MLPVENSSRPSGSLFLLAILAIFPLAAKIVAMSSGATGFAWQSTYKIFQLIAPVYWRNNMDGRQGFSVLWPVEEGRPSAMTWALAVAIAAALAGSAVAAILLLAEPLGIAPADVRAGLDARFALTPWKAVVAVAYLLTLNAALEELHFRAWLDPELSRRFGNLAGIGLANAMFAGMHLFIFAGTPGIGPVALGLLFAALLLAGTAWSLLRRRPGGIHAAWLSHGLTDAGLLTWGLFWLGYF